MHSGPPHRLSSCEVLPLTLFRFYPLPACWLWAPDRSGPRRAEPVGLDRGRRAPGMAFRLEVSHSDESYPEALTEGTRHRGGKGPAADNRGSRIVPRSEASVAVRIVSDDLWHKVKSGELEGFSIGGSAARSKTHALAFDA